MPTLHDQMLRKILREYGSIIKRHKLGSQVDSSKLSIELPTPKGIMDIVDTKNSLIIEVKTEIFDIGSHIRQLNQYGLVYSQFKKVLIYPKKHKEEVEEYGIMFEKSNIKLVFIDTSKMSANDFNAFIESFKDDGQHHNFRRGGRGRIIEPPI